MLKDFTIPGLTVSLYEPATRVSPEYIEYNSNDGLKVGLAVFPETSGMKFHIEIEVNNRYAIAVHIDDVISKLEEFEDYRKFRLREKMRSFLG